MLSIQKLVQLQIEILNCIDSADKVTGLIQLLDTLRGQEILLVNLNKINPTTDKITHLLSIGALMARAEVDLRDIKINILLAK
jgi:hypothetical protein